MKDTKGMVYVFEGDGKGKTSAALGVALRMLLLQKHVVWISWFKEESWNMAETKLQEVFKDNLEMHWMGKGFLGGPVDHDTPEGHRMAAVEALSLAKEKLDKKDGGGGINVDLLIMDEVLTAIQKDLITVKDLEKIIKLRGKTHLVMTGHVLPEKIKKLADLITEMKKIKHPYDKGILAVRGLDF